MEPVVSLKGLLEGLAEALEKAPPEPQALAEAGAAALLRAREARASDLLREAALLAAQEEAPEALAQGFARLLQEAMGGGRMALFAHPEGGRPCRYLGGRASPPGRRPG